jgi:hypothetical protein
LDAVFVTVALATFACWYGVLFYLQPFDSTGPLIRMIFEIIKDIRWFVLVLAIAVIASANAFYVLVRRDTKCAHGGMCSDVYVDPAEALFTMFNMLLLGNFDTSDYALGPYSILLKLLFVGSMLLVAIVLLNLLIAIMGNSYSRIKERQATELTALRTAILMELELDMSDADLQRKDWFPSYLHVLVRQGQNKPTEQVVDQTSNKLDQITSDIKGFESSLNKMQAAGVQAGLQQESIVDGFAVAAIADVIGTSEANLGSKVTQLQGDVRADMSHLEGKLRYDVAQVDAKVAQVDTKMSQFEAITGLFCVSFSDEDADIPVVLLF